MAVQSDNRAAADWFARLRHPDASVDDRQRFAAWLNEDPRHGLAFDALCDTWEQAAPLAQVALPEDLEDKIAQLANVAPGAAEPASDVVRPASQNNETGTRGAWVWLGSGLATTASAWLAWAFLTAPLALSTAVGELSTHALEDGSQVHLNTASEVAVTLDDDARTLELSAGELFVDVAHNPAAPLTVVTPHGCVTALGTAFAVRTTLEQSYLYVTDGTVTLCAVGNEPASERVFHAGDSAVFDNESFEAVLVDPTIATSWRDGKLIYNGVRMADLIRDLNRYMPHQMTITDDALADRRVSAVLSVTDQATTLKALAETFDLSWRLINPQTIELAPATAS